MTELYGLFYVGGRQARLDIFWAHILQQIMKEATTDFHNILYVISGYIAPSG